MMEKSYPIYWILAVVFALVFGEFLPGIASQNSVFFQHPIPITLYYMILCGVFALIAHRLSLLGSEIIFFAYGVLVELFVFGNIHGPLDILGIGFFGLLYIVLFGAPIIVTEKILNKKITSEKKIIS